MKLGIAKFYPEEIEKIKKLKPVVGNVLDLEMYNDANYFHIIKAYQNNVLVGYGVLFLGCNGLESNDVSLEDIVYFGEPKELFKFINEFIHELIYHDNYVYKVENYYYNQDNIIEPIRITLGCYNFMPKGKTR